MSGSRQGTGTLRPPRYRVFAVLTLTATVLLVLATAEGVLRLWPRILGFERLAYLPEPLKLAMGTRFPHAYRDTALAYFSAAGVEPPGLRHTVPDERYGLRLGPPGRPQAASAAWPVATDALGFRNPRVPPRADLLFVGDSFTAGATGTRAHRYEQIFATRVGDVTGLVTYQAACYGWGPRQYALAIREAGAVVTPQWVILCTYFENDIGDVWVYDGWKSSPFRTYAEFRMYRGVELRHNARTHWPFTQSILANLVWFALDRTTPAPVALPHAPLKRSDQYRDIPLLPIDDIPRIPDTPAVELRAVAADPGRELRVELRESGGPRVVRLRWHVEDMRASGRVLVHSPWWPAYAEALAHSVREARALGARALIVLIPSKERVLAPAAAATALPGGWPLQAGLVPDGAARAVGSLAASMGAEFLDLAVPLRAALPREGLGYEDDGIHFNELGHRVVADSIAPVLAAHAADSAGD